MGNEEKHTIAGPVTKKKRFKLILNFLKNLN